MSHTVHEPNHAGDCIFCGKHVGKLVRTNAMNSTNDTGHSLEVKASLRAIQRVSDKRLGQDYSLLDLCLDAIKEYEELRDEQ